jgi:hypothetical protein
MLLFWGIIGKPNQEQFAWRPINVTGHVLMSGADVQSTSVRGYSPFRCSNAISQSRIWKFRNAKPEDQKCITLVYKFHTANKFTNAVRQFTNSTELTS